MAKTCILDKSELSINDALNHLERYADAVVQHIVDGSDMSQIGYNLYSIDYHDDDKPAVFSRDDVEALFLSDAFIVLDNQSTQ